MSEPEQSSPEWVTIAEAARRLGVQERQARRWGERLPADARRQEDIGGGRSRALVQLAALRFLVSGQVSGQVTGQDRTEDAPGRRASAAGYTAAPQEAPPAPEVAPDPAPDFAESFAPPAQELGLTLALAMAVQREGYERVISEMNLRQAEQAARVCDLQASLEHERQTSARWQEALAQSAELLAREQMLRALPPPPIEPLPKPGPWSRLIRFLRLRLS